MTTDVSGKLGHAEGAQMTEEEFLAAYEAKDYPRPSVTVDLCIFTIIDEALHVLLIERGGHPYRGKLAFPGGFVDVGEAVGANQGEDIEDAAARELKEETGLEELFLEQLYTFGASCRDPRTRVISVAYYALVPPGKAADVQAGDDARTAEWIPISKVPWADLAFDHAKMLQVALERVRGKIDYAPLAFELAPKTFTETELRRVYEIIKGEGYDRGNFRKRFTRMIEDGIIEVTEGKRGTRRPAKLYRFGTWT